MDSNHTYIKGPREKRSPCPALNALANHGYINRDGQNIKFRDLVNALTRVYNLDWKYAAVLAAVGIVLCGNPLKGEVNLHDLARHNVIEHDFSLAHRDANGREFAPTVPSETLVKELLAVNGEDKEYLTTRDFIKRREDLMKGKKGLNAIHDKAASGEVIMIVDEFGENATIKHRDGTTSPEICVPKEYLYAWLFEERLPSDLGWRGARKKLTFTEINEQQTEYKRLTEEIAGKAEGDSAITKIFEHVHSRIDGILKRGSKEKKECVMH